MTERSHGVMDIAQRLGMSDKGLCLWMHLAKEQPVKTMLEPRLLNKIFEKRS